MPLTRDFRGTVKARADRDTTFRAGLYQEAVEAMMNGDLGTAKILLRAVSNATIGFGGLAGHVGMPEKSLMRMFGSAENPRADKLIAVVTAMWKACQLSMTVGTAPLCRRAAWEQEHKAAQTGASWCMRYSLSHPPR